MNNIVPAGEQRTIFNAILHDTISPNVFHSGDKANVIPGRAETVIDCRLLPGTDENEFIENLKKEIQSYTDLKFKLEVFHRGEAATWSPDTDLYRHLRKKIEEADPGAIVVPNLTSGFTDSKFLKILGITCYGFTPIKIPENLRFAELFHGHNERIPVDGFLWGLRLFFETIREFAAVE